MNEILMMLYVTLLSLSFFLSLSLSTQSVLQSKANSAIITSQIEPEDLNYLSIH